VRLEQNIVYQSRAIARVAISIGMVEVGPKYLYPEANRSR